MPMAPVSGKDKICLQPHPKKYFRSPSNIHLGLAASHYNLSRKVFFPNYTSRQYERYCSYN